MASAEKIIAENSQLIDIDSVKAFHKNPRKGDVEGIRESLRENGQFRPIIVNKRTMEIVGGNHTWKAAKAEGWTQISAAFIDVDDERAAKIVLADNRLNDRASYDTDILSELLATLPDPNLGTGYSTDEVNALLDAAAKADAELLQAIAKPVVPINLELGELDRERDNYVGGTLPQKGEVGQVDLGKIEDPAPLPDEPDKFAESDEWLSGAFDLKIGHYYELTGGLDIPPLRPEMLALPEDIPDNLLAWAGSATKDWPDEDQWWLYNFGIDSTSGMKDVSKMIMAFYTHDDYFENWWEYPDRYVAKMINSRVKIAIQPDYSLWAEDPMVLSMYNLYRARYVARYMQDAGIKVIPNIHTRYGDKAFFDNYVRATLPKELPVIAMQLQTWDETLSEEEKSDLIEMLEYMGKECNPQLTLFYVGKQAKPVVEAIPWPGEKRIIVNRMEALSQQAKGRVRKKTF